MSKRIEQTSHFLSSSVFPKLRFSSGPQSSSNSTVASTGSPHCGAFRLSNMISGYSICTTNVEKLLSPNSLPRLESRAAAPPSIAALGLKFPASIRTKFRNKHSSPFQTTSRLNSNGRSRLDSVACCPARFIARFLSFAIAHDTH